MGTEAVHREESGASEPRHQRSECAGGCSAAAEEGGDANGVLIDLEVGSAGNIDAPPEVSGGTEIDQKDMINLPNDIYNLFFLSPMGGQAFFYALYVFLLKMVIFTFLAMDTVEPIKVSVSTAVMVSQFLMLPVAIAIQDDLISTYYLICNCRYWPRIQRDNPHASKFKFRMANALRAIDGHYSMIVNVLILLSAVDVLGLFLNFAALQFLQTVDNLALTLAADGLFTDTLKKEAERVVEAKLPQQRSSSIFLKWLDTSVFFALLAVLVIAWALATFKYKFT